MGNRKITALLDERPKNEFEELRRFKDDSNEAFDGFNGGGMTIGALIQIHLGDR